MTIVNHKMAPAVNHFAAPTALVRPCKQASRSVRQDEPNRYDVTPGAGQAVLSDHCYFPEPVLKILVKKTRQSRARRIPGNDGRALPDPSTGPSQPQVQFVILVADQGFVEQSER